MTLLDNLLIHPKTKKQAMIFLRSPANSLLILGGSGSGKLSLAKSLASELLGLHSPEQLSAYPYFFHAKKPADKQEISIDTIREIIRFMHLKTPGSGAVRRIVLIENAHYLSVEAQNALLKVLEEPNEDTVFLLTAPFQLSLLPTIVSRCQHIWTYPVTIQQSADYFGSRFSSNRLQTAWQLSQGSSALLEALLSDDKKHRLKQTVEQAKELLKQPRYSRLLTLDKLARNRDDFRLFLEALAKVLAALHHSALAKKSTEQANKILHDRKLVHASSDALDVNGNARLIALKLLLNLSI